MIRCIKKVIPQIGISCIGVDCNSKPDRFTLNSVSRNNTIERFYVLINVLYGDFEIIILIVGMNCIRCGKGANLRCRSSCFQVVQANACGRCLMSYIPSNFFVF